MTKLEQYHTLLRAEEAKGREGIWCQPVMSISDLKQTITRSFHNRELVMLIWWRAMEKIGVGNDDTWWQVYNFGWNDNPNTQSLKKVVEAMLVEKSKPFDEGDYL